MTFDEFQCEVGKIIGTYVNYHEKVCPSMKTGMILSITAEDLLKISIIKRIKSTLFPQVQGGIRLVFPESSTFCTYCKGIWIGSGEEEQIERISDSLETKKIGPVKKYF